MLKIWKGKWKQQKEKIESGRAQDNEKDDDTRTAFSADSQFASSSKRPPSSDLSSEPLERPSKRRKRNAQDEPPVHGFPRETIVLYDTPSKEPSNSLTLLVRNAVHNHPFLHPFLVAAQRVYDELGVCASNLWWKRAVTDIERGLPLYSDSDDKKGMETHVRIKARDKINNFDFTMPNFNIYTLGFNVSPKLLRLVQILKTHEPIRPSFRAVVFVDSQLVASAITDLIKAAADLDAFKCRAFTGQERVQDQRELFQAFTKGDFNLLIATTSSEDLDIPRASLVVRYSLSSGYLSHAYTYSRTNGSESHVVLLAERENPIHRRTIELLSGMSESLKAWGTSTEPAFFPPTTFDELKPFIKPAREDSGEEHLIEPLTGNRIYLTDATLLVFRFGALLRERSPALSPNDFKIEFEPDQTDDSLNVRCRISLASHSFCGATSSSKSIARRHACYEACSQLMRLGLIGYQVPIPAISVDNVHPTMPPLSDKNAATREYGIKRPNFWQGYRFNPTNVLYPMVICAEAVNAGDKTYAPLVLLTRDPLPDIPQIKLWFSGSDAVVPLLRAAPMEVDDHQLNLLRMYTIRLFRVLTNRRESCPLEQFPYFFAPLAPNWQAERLDGSNSHRLSDLTHDVAWATMDFVVNNFSVPLKYGHADVVREDIVDALIQDRPTEFTRRYETITLRPDMTPLSKPENQKPGGDPNESILDYIRSHSTTFQGLKDENQCIIQATTKSTWFDHLMPAFIPPPESPYPKYIIPELSSKSTIAASVFRTGSLLHSIMSRIDEHLLVKELNANYFSHSISEDLLHVAITAPSVAYEFNYERLELLGDAVLKYMTSIYVFVTEPQDAGLHSIRRDLISNASLLSRAVQINLPRYMRSKPPQIRNWTMPNFYLEEESPQAPKPPPPPPPSAETVTDGATPTPPTVKRKNKKKKKTAVFYAEATQWLGDKAIADVCEAIIGAAYQTGGIEVALQTIKDLSIPLPRVERWSDLVRLAVMPSPHITAPLKPGALEAVEGILGYKFKRPYLLAQALTHISHAGPSYERLEFLGDAVLEILAVDYIFEWDDKLSPGTLTELKIAMVSNTTLAAISVYSGLSKYVLTDSTELANNCQLYEQRIQEKLAEEIDNAEKEGRSPGHYWLAFEPPKALADIVESILAAAFVAENFNIGGAKLIFERLLKPFFERHITLETMTQHPTQILFERVHAIGCRSVGTIKKEEFGRYECAVWVHDTMLGKGIEASFPLASRTASLAGLALLDRDPTLLTRTCNCGIST